MGCGASTEVEQTEVPHKATPKDSKYLHSSAADSSHTNPNDPCSEEGETPTAVALSSAPLLCLSDRQRIARTLEMEFKGVRRVLTVVVKIKAAMKKWTRRIRSRLAAKRNDAEANNKSNDNATSTTRSDNTSSEPTQGNRRPSVTILTTVAVTDDDVKEEVECERQECAAHAAQSAGAQSSGSDSKATDPPTETHELVTSPPASEAENDNRPPTCFSGPTTPFLFINTNTICGDDADKCRSPKSKFVRHDDASELPDFPVDTVRMLARKESRQDHIQEGVNIIAKRLTSLNLVQVPMEDDGNCLFRALAHQIFGDPSKHAAVRAAVCEHMRAHKSSDYDFLFSSPEECDAYINNMMEDGMWGDELCLRASIDSFGLTVHVLSSSESDYYVKYTPNMYVVEEEWGETMDVFLAFIAPLHYNSIILCGHK